DSTQLPAYKRFPTLPPVKLLLADSISHFGKENFNKKSPVLIIIFNPDCEHCQKETEELLDSMNHFKNIQIVMATMMPFDKMNEFIKKYKLDNFKNIVVGQDNQYFLPVFYMVSNLPYLALYNKMGELITTYEGAVPIHTVINKFNE
ncbi:MAG: redoxin domain-containing protein, partial [Bacteroidetes bacterium]|nr:redoxin domain-containing protein [Bacteroidota bacterium]